MTSTFAIDTLQAAAVKFVTKPSLLYLAVTTPARGKFDPLSRTTAPPCVPNGCPVMDVIVNSPPR